MAQFKTGLKDLSSNLKDPVHNNFGAQNDELYLHWALLS